MSEDQFTKLFKYIESRFSDMDKRFDGVHQDIDGLRNAVDSFAKQALDLQQEFIMLSRKVDRMETWIQQIAKKTGVELPY
jgi:archaellum component FlaC